MNNKIKIIACTIVLFIAGIAEADLNKLLAKTDPKDRSTIDSFPLESLEEDALEKAVIEGGLSPTSAGNKQQKQQTQQTQQLSIEYYEVQTDRLDVNIHYQSPKFSDPTGRGVVHSEDYYVSDSWH